MGWERWPVVNAVPVQWIGGDMTVSNDREFDRLQEWFTPKRIKRILQEWHARYEPWAYTHPDERGVNYKPDGGTVPFDRQLSRVDIAGAVQTSLNKLAMQRPDLYDIIIGFYLDVELKQDEDRPHVINMQPRMNVFQLADWQGIHPRTCYKRELAAREWIARDLGWKPARERE